MSASGREYSSIDTLHPCHTLRNRTILPISRYAPILNTMTSIEEIRRIRGDVLGIDSYKIGLDENSIDCMGFTVFEQ